MSVKTTGGAAVRSVLEPAGEAKGVVGISSSRLLLFACEFSSPSGEVFVADILFSHCEPVEWSFWLLGIQRMQAINITWQLNI